MSRIKTIATRDLNKSVQNGAAANARHLASPLAKHPAA